jgi:hypothetical protein
MPLQELAKLLLKRAYSMMLLLPFDVGNDISLLQQPDRESTVPILPIEGIESLPLFLQPSGRPLLEMHDNIRNVCRPVEVEEHVEMVGNIVHFNEMTLPIFENATAISM